MTTAYTPDLSPITDDIHPAIGPWELPVFVAEHDLATEEQLDAIDEEVKAEVMDAVEFAENSPFPPVETMYEDVYVQEDYPFIS
jgi:pyruvate dehydrogenase E1 component alpha subunit